MTRAWAVRAVACATALTACGQAGGPAGTARTGSTGPTGPPPSSAAPVRGGAPAGTVTGQYREGPQGGPATPVAGVTVGLFPAEFVPGSNGLGGSAGAGGAAVARAETDRRGAFELRGVPTGTWFLTRPDGAVVVRGRWVQVDAEQGAAVDLEGCTTCPPAA